MLSLGCLTAEDSLFVMLVASLLIFSRGMFLNSFDLSLFVCQIHISQLSTFYNRYFKQSKLTSFQRQLNLYGFQRIMSGDDRGGYFHELFLKGRPEVCSLILRTRVKKGLTKAGKSSEEVDLYAFPAIKSKDLNSRKTTVELPDPVTSTAHVVSSSDESCSDNSCSNEEDVGDSLEGDIVGKCSALAHSAVPALQSVVVATPLQPPLTFSSRLSAKDFEPTPMIPTPAFPLMTSDCLLAPSQSNNDMQPIRRVSGTLEESGEATFEGRTFQFIDCCDLDDLTEIDETNFCVC